MSKLKLSLSLIALLLSVFGLFQIKFKVQNLRSEFVEIKQQLKYEKDAIHVLKAEWEYLNRLPRLQKLTEKFLQMEQVKAEQIKISKKDFIITAEESNIFVSIPKANTTKPEIITVSLANKKSSKKSRWRYRERPVLFAKKSK